jgi:hypothetical protein
MAACPWAEVTVERAEPRLTVIFPPARSVSTVVPEDSLGVARHQLLI